jgi:hypothetical protein
MLRGTPGCLRISWGVLQRHHHLVHGGGADLEEALHIGLGGRSADDQGVGVDEGQVLPLARGEAGSRIACHRILVCVLCMKGTAMNVCWRVELNQEERD